MSLAAEQFAQAMRFREADLKSIQDQIGVLKADFLRTYSPVKIGQEVVVNGYAHQGKIMKVQELFIRRYGRDEQGFQIVARGMMVRRDGLTGSRLCESYFNLDGSSAR